MPFPLTCARMVRATHSAVLLLLAQLWGGLALAQSPTRLLGDVTLELMSVDDSSQYFVYRYRVLNSASSRSGVAGINLDLSARRGTGIATLPSTGPFIHGAATAVGPVTDHVPVGVIAPEEWNAALMPNGFLHWSPIEGYLTQNGKAVPFTRDSAPPGGSKEGLGLRSPFLAGIRRFSAEPTLASCCARPKPSSPDGEYPPPGAFRVRDFAVAPTVRPQELSISLIRSDLRQSCGTLRWIPARAVCEGLRSTVERARMARERNDHEGAKSSLRAFVDELEAQHGPGKPVSDNAYWLLKLNGQYLLEHM
jgi:hypothetical protein